MGHESITFGGFSNITFLLFVRCGQSAPVIVDRVTAHVFVFYTFSIRDVLRRRKHEKQRKNTTTNLMKLYFLIAVLLPPNEHHGTSIEFMKYMVLF
jgi:hypothetical protein